jgi:hypothetical protein
MTTTIAEVSSKAEALEAWDKEGVVIREDDGYVYVYPLLGKGVMYPNFDLRRECNLMGFSDVEQAVFWAKSRGYVPHVIGSRQI